MSVISKIVGTHSQRELKRHQKTLEKILALKPEVEQLNEEQMKAKTAELKERLKKRRDFGGYSPRGICPGSGGDKENAWYRTLSMSVTWWYYLT